MKNCCDYDAIVHYQSGQFSAMYKTDLTGKLKKIELDHSLSQNDINSFKDGYYNTYITQEPIVLYRIYGQYQKNSQVEAGKYPRGARLQGRYVSTEFAESVIDAKMRLALDPGWLNTKMFEAKLLVPKGIRLSMGIVGSVTLNTGTVLPGGADQLLLPAQWPIEWVQGYRRVTARQLQTQPHYWPDKPGEIAVGKGELYPRLCPLCGYEQTKKLDDIEQFEIIGIKGNRYVMKSQCLNPDCEYYW